MTRTNEEWLQALHSTGAAREAALNELRAILLKGLHYALADRKELAALVNAEREQLLQDFVQVALTRILDNLDSFRGESAFTTWAQKIAVRVALTELRRQRWHDVSLDQLTQIDEAETTPAFLADTAPTPEQIALRRSLMETIERVITEELTEKQRQAMLATVRGVPFEEVANQVGSNRNALYKLIFDARQRLRKRLEAEGLTLDDVRAAFE